MNSKINYTELLEEFTIKHLRNVRIRQYTVALLVELRERSDLMSSLTEGFEYTDEVLDEFETDYAPLEVDTLDDLINEFNIIDIDDLMVGC